MKLIINGKPVEADGFMFDGCHKLYVIDSPEGREQILGLGWSEGDIRPLSELPSAWAESCPLRFISSADLKQDYVEQCMDAVIHEVAGDIHIDTFDPEGDDE